MPALHIGFPVDGNQNAPFTLDPAHLVTHGVCFGMTGSGKTGLSIALLEEAALAGIPVIAIDPKGDLVNMFFAFKEPEEYGPFVDPAQAKRGGCSVEELAAKTAATWHSGRVEAGIANKLDAYRERISFSLYTPGSDAGEALSILKSFDRPPPELANDRELLIERGEVLSESLLGLLPRDKAQHEKRKVFLAALLDHEWRKGHNVQLHDLVRAVFNPPARVGALDIETWMPSRERKRFAQELNTLIGSPRFNLWSAGAPIDFDTFCDKGERQGKVNIIHIAHLSESERHFIVSLILSEAISWMRRQRGTSGLRALIYMDEVAGYLPPIGAPAPKRPMLTLLKQARAFGLGVVLSTQNPMDIDYKAISNMGLWMVGKLTTERDRKRLVDGLASSDTASGVDKKSLHATIAGLGKRQFYIHSMYSEPAVIRSRHTLSWLRGPLTRDEIARLCSKADEDPEAERWRKLEAYTARLEQIDIAGQEQVAILKRLRARRPGGWRLGTIGMLLFGGRFGRLQAMRQANRVNVKLEQEIAECESRIQAMADEADEIVAGIERLRQEATCGV